MVYMAIVDVVLAIKWWSELKTVVSETFRFLPGFAAVEPLNDGLPSTALPDTDKLSESHHSHATITTVKTQAYHAHDSSVAASDECVFAHLIPLSTAAIDAVRRTGEGESQYHREFVKIIHIDEHDTPAFELRLDHLPLNPDMGWHVGKGHISMLNHGVDLRLTPQNNDIHTRHIRLAWVKGKIGFFVFNIGSSLPVSVNGSPLKRFAYTALQEESSAIQIADHLFRFKFVSFTDRQKLEFDTHLRSFMEQVFRESNPFIAPTPSDKDRTWGTYLLHSILGQGTYGTVYQASNRNTGEPVALKILNATQRTKHAVIHELSMCQRIHALSDHVNVLKPIEIIHSSSQLAADAHRRRAEHGLSPLDVPQLHGQAVLEQHIVVFNLINDNLDVTLKASKASVPTRLRVRLLSHLLSGIAFLHANGIAHRDIKPLNVLVQRFEPLELFITDYGSAIDTNKLPISYDSPGTVWHLAPEQVEGRYHEQSVDCWAAGLIGAQLLGYALRSRVQEGAPYQGVMSFLKQMQADGDLVETAKVVERLLALQPSERITAKKAHEMLEKHLEKTRPESEACRELGPAKPKRLRTAETID